MNSGESKNYWDALAGGKGDSEAKGVFGKGEYASIFRYPASRVLRAAATSVVGFSNSAISP